MHYLIIIYYLIKNNTRARPHTHVFFLILKNLILLKNINILQIYLPSCRGRYTRHQEIVWDPLANGSTEFLQPHLRTPYGSEYSIWQVVRHQWVSQEFPVCQEKESLVSCHYCL